MPTKTTPNLTFEYKGRKFRENNGRIEVAYTGIDKKNECFVEKWRKHSMSNGYKLLEIFDVKRISNVFP